MPCSTSATEPETGTVLVHDVIGFGRGETPAQPIRLLQLLDSRQRVIFELVAQPDRRLYLTSPEGGLRSTPLLLPTRATVPNDGIAGVAVDVAVKANESVAVSVNGVRTAAVPKLRGARTGGATIPRSRSDRLLRTAGCDRDQRDSRAGVGLHVLGAGSDCPRCAGRAVTTTGAAAAGESAPAAQLALPADDLGPRRRRQHADRCPRELERRHRYVHLRMGAL